MMRYPPASVANYVAQWARNLAPTLAAQVIDDAMTRPPILIAVMLAEDAEGCYVANNLGDMEPDAEVAIVIQGLETAIASLRKNAEHRRVIDDGE